MIKLKDIIMSLNFQVAIDLLSFKKDGYEVKKNIETFLSKQQE